MNFGFKLDLRIGIKLIKNKLIIMILFFIYVIIYGKEMLRG